MAYMDVAGPDLADFRLRRLFLRSTNPMLVADDARRFSGANAAACLFLRLSEGEITTRTIDDLTPAQRRPELEARWSEFLRSGGSRRDGRTLAWDLQLPDGTSVAIHFSGTPYVQPGSHLATIRFPAARTLNERLDAATPPINDVLTKREREILTLVALGNTGVQIAQQLFLSPATVATHVTNALVKLQAKNRAHGIAIALQSGELDVDERLHGPAGDQRVTPHR